MIFILQENTMNGTVTMGTNCIGVEAETFDDAVKKVKSIIAKNGTPIVNAYEDKERFSFCVQQEDGVDLGMFCTMNDKPLKMLD